MCGIAGVFDLVGQNKIDQSLLLRMANAIAHRGPDGEGVHLEPGLGLGHRRLAIIDVGGGQQPMFSPDGAVALVYNGEIYNYRELISELSALGCVFRTHCDTEVIVHAWERWGPDCVKRFRGMFAFALHDRRRGCLFLARDRLGKKPLYYTVVEGRYFLFASELKALLVHPLVERKLDTVAVDNYFAFGYVPDPRTIYAGIKKLPPAHTLLVRRGAPVGEPDRYWRMNFAFREISQADAAEEIIAKLRESSRIRLMSEVPLGAFLSGGVDSSGVVAMMAGEMDAPVKTFAIGLGDEGADERDHARRVAERYHTEHREEQVSIDPLDNYRTQAAIFDEPFADSSCIPTYRVSQLARRHVTVALSGDAGDEIFGGYRRYRMFAEAEKWRERLPEGFRRNVFGVLGSFYPKLDWAPQWARGKNTFQELASESAFGYYRTLCRIHDGPRHALYAAGMRAAISGHDPSSLIKDAMDEADTGDALARAQYADFKTYLPGDILTKVDRCSMATSLEVRVPMLDHEFVEMAARFPRSLCLEGGEGKSILKRALEPYVPKENLYRKKQGFGTSLAPYFRGAGTAAVRKALLGEAMMDCGLFAREPIAAMIDAHETGLHDHSRALWTLLMFEGFLSQVHYAGSVASSAPALMVG
ncbi:MAG: XrtA/PEP-CTERM system amidotransferase [Rhizomicrobium sp.]